MEKKMKERKKKEPLSLACHIQATEIQDSGGCSDGSAGSQHPHSFLKGTPKHRALLGFRGIKVPKCLCGQVLELFSPGRLQA